MGASASSNPLFENTYGRAVAIEISNYSLKYDLCNPSYFTTSGYCCNPPPPTINREDGKGVCVFTKTDGIPCGCVGVLTYQAGDCSFAIMFSNPFSHVIFGICYGLEIFNRHRKADESLFKEMCHSTAYSEKRNEVGYSSNHLEFSYCGIQVKATMSYSYKCIMKVEIRDVSE
ncbi:DELTA-stichotoxin-Hcr4a-like [Protopterus annectens]|uniref:DELTA-stichotoxin-Hcr4a-like n=1 Tax=Protopterus annectens TaxID=7888 RepID=UPI001CFB06E5|nr:DELTA-stichotoxin-Hcr4a-like [Protopterus annectens]